MGNPVVEQGRMLIPTTDGITALDAQTGRLLWQWHDPGGTDLALLGGAGNQVYLAEETKYKNALLVNHPHMYALDVTKGTVRWSVAMIDDVFRLRVLATNNLVYVAAAGKVYTYTAQDGRVLWHMQLAQSGG